jgi:hypothetical protein
MSYATGIGQATINKKEKQPMIKLTIRYARYVLSTLATVGFGIQLN